MDTNDASTEQTPDFTDRRISALERELVNAKNHVRRLQIQLSELKQRQQRNQSARSRIAEVFLSSSASGNANETLGD